MAKSRKDTSAWSSPSGSEDEATKIPGGTPSANPTPQHVALPAPMIPQDVADLENSSSEAEQVVPINRTEILILRGKEKRAPHISQSNSSLETKTPLRPSRDILNRIEWDSTCCNKDDVVIGYLDRHDGILEIDFANWKRETTDEEFIPQHRIRYVKQKSDGVVLWDRAKRVDKIFGSGHGRCEASTVSKAVAARADASVADEQEA